MSACCAGLMRLKSRGKVMEMKLVKKKIKQMVANTSQKGDILDIDNDNLQHTKLLWKAT